MSRNKGTFNYSANLEGIVKAPIDAKQLVNAYSGLTSSTAWEDNNGVNWLFNGAIVSVGNDIEPSKIGVYYLKDVDNYINEESWIKLGESAEISIGENIGDGDGEIFAEKTGNTFQFRTIIGSGHTIVSTIDDNVIINSTGQTVSASNGLNIDENNDIKLGGELSENTIISGDSKFLKLTYLDQFEIQTDDNTSVSISDNTGLIYGDDYEDYFLPRSLVTKQYVDYYKMYNVTGTTYYVTTSDEIIEANAGNIIVLPESPDKGKKIIIVDISGNAEDNPIIINGDILNDDHAKINTDFGSITLVYNTNNFWSVIGFVN